MSKSLSKAQALADQYRLDGHWKDQDFQAIPSLLLDWYDHQGRDLPWRVKGDATRNPYHTWLSEVMLQQTTVGAVKSYFDKFTQNWPTVQDLANAENDDVMAAWAGLGYYARARNLHACAKVVTEDYQGKFPSFEEDLLKLPGVGRYTAAAIAAIAFDRPAVVVDGNIERVMSRLFRFEEPFPANRDAIWPLAGLVTPSLRAGDYAQSLMDLGSSICTPKNPKCMLCPIRDFCRGQEIAESLPKKIKKTDKPIRHARLLAIRNHKGEYLLQKRPPKGLLGGMLEFPGSDWSKKGANGEEQLPDWGLEGLKNQIAQLESSPPLGQVSHVFTHFRLEITLFPLHLDKEAQQELDRLCANYWIKPEDFADNALPSVMMKAGKLVSQT